VPAPVDKLASIVGAPYVLTGVDCSPYVLDGRTPEAVVLPGSKEEVAAVLALAFEEGIAVTPWGGGTKMGIGSPPSCLSIVLRLGRLQRVVEHEPADLTATVEAGLPVAGLQAALGRRGQWLSLDPADPERATVGGVLAANASGPRRHLYGTARDLVIGLTMALADGTLVRGGGKVVKNVAGYDLPKLAIGSFGTLGVIVEATLKLRPKPDRDRLVIVPFDRIKDAEQAVRAVMASDLVPSAVEVLDTAAAGGLALGTPERPAVLIGVDGPAAQVAWQCDQVPRLLAGLAAAPARVLEGEACDRAWAALTALPRTAFPGAVAVMKWGVLPTQAAELIEQGSSIAHRAGLRAAFVAHAGVGIISAALSGAGAGVETVIAVLAEWRSMVAGAGGHAMLEWAPLGVKEAVAVWDRPGPAHRIMMRIKEQLDPKGILNPGRFVGEI